MLTAMVFLPLAGALLLFLPSKRAVWTAIDLSASGGALALAAATAAMLDWQTGAFGLQERIEWIHSLGASYYLAVDGISLPLVLLTTLLTFLALLYSRNQPHYPRAFFAMFLIMETGLLGVLTTLDLLLFYLFWEVALVPMYCIIGVWGYERRIEAALKFFLYTRVGSLAMLLCILALYLGTEPRTFNLLEIVGPAPVKGAGVVPSLVLLGFFIGFAIKLPVVPFHSWLPDAHTEAPTGGSVLLAGVLLKMGGYGFIRLALPTVPEAFSVWALPIAALAVASAIYGAAVAMAQQDLKRLVAFSSVNHMGYVMLGVAVAAVALAGPEDRAAAATGAVYLLVAHGLVTGALFFLVGMLSERTETRDIGRLSGLWAATPLLGSALAFAMFASLGLPALANFAAEVQILLGTLGIYWWAAVAMLLGILVTTAMFIWTLQRVLLGRLPERWSQLPPLKPAELGIMASLVALIVLLGVAPGPLSRLIDAALRNGPLTVLP
jgi:NADH-quinone oxidoreductase subunit M